jgi:hypothetical protein
MSITPLPSLDRSSATFKSDVDTFFGTQLPQFVTETNAAADDINAALSNANLGFTATSSSSLAIGTGSKTFTTQSGKGFAIGQRVRATNDADVAKYMVGTVTSYSGTTLIVSVDKVGGSGTLSAWTISIDVPEPSFGLGGATASANVTLTNASSAVQVFTDTAFGAFVALPDATTMSEGGPHFHLRNLGDCERPIRDGGGTLKGFVPPRASVTAWLLDNASAAGQWVLDGAAPAGISALWPATGAFTVRSVVEIDADRTLVLGFNSTDLKGIVYDRSDNSWGSLTTLRSAAAAPYPNGVLVGTDKVLVFSLESGGAGVAAFAVTIAGKTLTPGAVATQAGTVDQAVPDIVACGASYIARCRYGSLIAATVAGTTVTLGAIAATTTAYSAAAGVLAVNAATLVSFGATGTAYYAQAFSVAGTALTPGTENARTGLTGTISALRAMMNGGRLWFCTLGSTNACYPSLYSFSGTTISRSDVGVLGFTGTLSASSWIAVSTTKVLVALGTSGKFFYHLTDADGVLSASSYLSVSGDNTTVAVVRDDAGTVYVWLHHANGDKYGAIDTSGATPAIHASHPFELSPISASDDTLCAPLAQSQYGRRALNHLHAANRSVVVPGYGTPGTFAAELGARLRMFVADNRMMSPSGTSAAKGAADEAVFVSFGATGTYNYAIGKVEIAQ